MEKPTLNFTLAQGDGVEKPIIVHLLEGMLPKPIDLQPVHIAGDIDTVGNFIKTREETIDKNNSTIYFSELARSIKMLVNENHPNKITVAGVLTAYPELLAFQINEDKKFTLDGVRKLIRMNRIFFTDKDKHAELLNQLQNFTAQVQASVTNEKDTRSNSNTGFKKIVTTGLAADFILTISLFIGGVPMTFRVEICYDVTDGSTAFWFESVELYELIKSETTKAFDAHRETFIDKGFTVINC